MKNLTINEFMDLASGKKWNVNTLIPDFGLGVAIIGATVTMDEGSNSIAIYNDGCTFTIEECDDTITAIEQDGESITVNLFNLPDLTFTESIF